jgi:hypothetical protein
LVEVFAHTPESLEHFYAQERGEGRSTLAHMVATGRVIADTGGGAAFRTAAQTILDAGPDALAQADVDRRRYMLTADLDDLADATDPDERDTIAAHITAQATDLYLRANGLWSGYGKWGQRHLATANPALASRLAAGRRAVIADGETSPLTEPVAEVLGALGGLLAEGYVVGGDSDDE